MDNNVRQMPLKASVVRQEERFRCLSELIEHVERMADYESERGIGDDETHGFCRACDQMLAILRKKIA